MMRSLGCGVILGLAALQLPSAARAQPAPPYDPAIELQLFEYASGPKTFFAVSDAEVGRERQLTLDVFFTFLTKPFTIYDVAAGTDGLSGTRAEVVQSLMTTELSAAYGLGGTLQLGVSLPVVLSMTGEGLDPTTAMASPDGLARRGLGDLRIELKRHLWRRGNLSVAAMAGLTLPSSFGDAGSAFLGDDLPTVRARAAAQWSAGRLTLGANGGVMLRKPREIYAAEIGQQLTWALGAALRVTERFFLVGESFGRTGLTRYDLDQSPVEAEGGVRVFVTSSVAFVAGGGAGIVKGIGSPELRIFTSLGYAPDVRDSDGDGIVNSRDACPSEKEDRDGWEDGDGCPDPDNDGDRRADDVDKCPNESEDFDGFDDADGCPELDNDGDGFPDLEDKCPSDVEDKKEPFPADGCPVHKHDADFDGFMDDVDRCVTDAEDVDGFEDGDGCPDPDQDHDGVDDDADQCPLCAEDKDGFEDDDGCPELDNDADGIPDAADRCPLEPETLNAVDDFDGCPDEGGITIATFDGERVLVERAPPFDRKGLTVAGALIVDQVALLLLAHPEVSRWLIAVAAPKKRDADRRAAWTRAHLQKRGVRADALELLSAAGAERLVAVAKERVDADAPKVCPTPEVQPRPDRSLAPAPAAATTPATPAKPAPAADDDEAASDAVDEISTDDGAQ
ncbi:MAG: transporter [Kofleriaceae bacterium]